MHVIKRLAAASFVFALTAGSGAHAAPPSTVGTLEIDDLGSTPVAAWSWGVSNSGTTHEGGGGGAGKANIQDVSITRYTDILSSVLMLSVANGHHFKKATLRDFPTTLELEDVLVNSYAVGDGGGDGKTPRTENITLNFAKVCYTSVGVKTCWDLKDNQTN